jgi:TonB family protein
VVKVRSYSSSSSYVEVEFTHRQPGFWGVYFESDAIAAPPAATPARVSEAPANSHGQTGLGATAPKNPALDKNASTFIAIGSQEDVQPAASSTSAVSSSLKTRTAGQDSKAFQKTAAQSSTSAHSISSQAHKTQQEEEDASVSSEALGVVSDTGTADDSNPRMSRALSGEAFSAHRESATQDTQGSEGKKNGLVIATVAAAFLLAAGIATLFWHHKSADSPAVQNQVPASPAPSRAAQVAVPQPVVSPPIVSKPNGFPQVSLRGTPTVPAKPAKDAVVITESTPAVAPEASAPATPARKVVPSVFGALNSHPIASHQQTDGVAAPSVDAAAPPSGDALAGITSSLVPGVAPAAANLRVTAPVQTSSGAKELKLLLRVIPQYPPIAKQTHTEGDVVLEITVDKSGSVTDAKAISGPTSLRMAAIGAVKRWKYQPFEGQTDSVRMPVTIQFRL